MEGKKDWMKIGERHRMSRVRVCREFSPKTKRTGSGALTPRWQGGCREVAGGPRVARGVGSEELPCPTRREALCL